MSETSPYVKLPAQVRSFDWRTQAQLARERLEADAAAARFAERHQRALLDPAAEVASLTPDHVSIRTRSGDAAKEFHPISNVRERSLCQIAGP
ncbi:MAG TPA: hypothetical protein VMW19_04315 [Myxococcota bacterium]|nr:hypothetical protein [Myxococcota bacterium]